MCLNASEPVTPELTGAYGRTVPNGIKISQKKQKNKVFPTANTKESVKR